MLKRLVTRATAPENQLCLSMRSERAKHHVLIATLVAIGIMAFGRAAYADLYVISPYSNSVLRYNEGTGAFIDTFVTPGSGGLLGPRGLLFGSDGNLYVTSHDNSSVMRYDGTTGAPLPASGQTGATFVAKGSGGLQDCG